MKKKKGNTERQESRGSFHSASPSLNSDESPKLGKAKQSRNPSRQASPKDRPPSFDTDTAPQTNVRQAPSSHPSLGDIPTEESYSSIIEQNRIIASIFCIHFSIFMVSLAAILICLFQDTVKFLITGRSLYYFCAGVLMGVLYILMFIRQVFRRRISLLRRRADFWDLVMLSLMAVFQAIFLGIVSAYYDTELILFATISVMLAYWMVSVVAIIRESHVIGWRMYLIGASVLGGIFVIEVLLMCFRAHCEFLGDIASATVLAAIITLHTIYASIIILRVKWQTMNPKTKNNAPILAYIFIPLVIFHAIEKRFTR